MFKRIILRYKESIWFLPSVFILGSIFLAIVITEIDIFFIDQFYETFPVFLYTSIDFARSILSVIATSLLTMTAIIFSTIMIVFSMYSAQYSPKTLQNFISDRLTQTVLGIFIAGFTYSIVSLLLIQEVKANIVVFNPIFAIVLALLCVGYFIRFIQYITVSIQINNLIENIRKEILKTLKQKNREIEEIKDDGKVLLRLSNKKDKNKKETPVQIFPYIAGHIQIFDIKGLIKYSNGQDIIVEANKRVGDYVTEKSLIFLIWNIKDKDEKDKIESSLKKYYSIGNYRNTDQDIVFSLEKLEEIALRAISPGINDPNTAIHCIRNLADILLEISKSYTGKLYFYDKEENLRFVLNDTSFEEILYSTFYKILNSSRNMISILASILESIIIISEAKNDKIKKILYDFTVYAINGFDIKLLQDHDIQFLNLKIKKIAKNLNINQLKILIS